MRRPFLPVLLLLVLAAAAPSAAFGQVSDTPPTATTRAASPVGQNTATVRGTIDPNGQPTSYRFEYGTSTAYGLQTADDTAGLGDDAVDVSAALSALSDDTTYHYRVIAWPDADPTAIVVGADRTFHTITLPTVSTNSARALRADGVTLDGKVDPNRSPTEVHFEWGPTMAYGNVTPAMDAGRGSASIEVSSVLNGLAPNTTYHFRIVATNAAGIKRGRDRGFRTLRLPTGITVAAPVLRAHYGGVATIDGQVQGVGVNGIRVALAAAPFPFKAPFTSASSVVSAGPDGSFHLVTPPMQIATRLHVVTRTTPAVVSPDVTVFPELIVRARALRRDNRRYRLTGTVTPHVTRARVSVQRKVGRKWVFAKRTTTKRLGRGRVGYDVTVNRARKTRRYRVVVTPRSAAYARTTSHSVKVPRIERHRGR
jgi:hypothetical protein